jgi:HNH endonuclease
MRCIFCLEEKAESEEHVFALAIGGCLTTNRVCASCNSKLGTSIDAPLIDHSLVLLRRAELGIAGRGDVPDAFQRILGTSVLASDKSRRLKTTIDPNTGKLDIRTIPYMSLAQQMPDGTTVKRLVLDARDIGRLGTIVQKIRARHNLSPLPTDEIEKIVLDAQENISTMENPEVLASLKFDTYKFMRGILKICYELAFLWFGDDYLEDQIAINTRRYITGL